MTEAHRTADVVIAVAPGQFVDRLTQALPADRTIWIHPDSAHQLGGIGEDSVAVIVISKTDCTEETLMTVLAASRSRDWSVFVLTDSSRVDHREHLLNAGASAVLSDGLAPAAVATLVRETLLGNLHMAQRSLRDEAPGPGFAGR